MFFRPDFPISNSPKTTLPAYCPASVIKLGPKVKIDGVSVEAATEYDT